jgi:(p)ppGpp synthase/HD superfamily hydrolase
VHPAEVASLLARLGYPDDVVAAAVLHDVLEDTDARLAELRSRFGSRVAELVAVVSDDPAIADEDERKAVARERVRAFGGDALAVYAADKVSKVSKVRELRLRMVTGLPAGEAEAKFARYRASLAMLEQELGDAHLVELLRFEVEALEQLPPAPTSSEQPEVEHAKQDLANEQRQAALAIANTVRGRRAALKRDIGSGAITLRDLLHSPSAPADGCTIAELLRSQAGWGPSRTLRFLTAHGVGEHKQLGQLTDRQRLVMAADLA